MRVYKEKLPEGVKKAFGRKRGVKVKLLNKDYYDKKKKSK